MQRESAFDAQNRVVVTCLATMASSTKLKPQTIEPPDALGTVGMRLWVDLTSEYDLSDAGSRHLLCQICQAFDRIAALRAIVDRDGEMIKTKKGKIENPACRAEQAHRAFAVRA